MSEELSRSERFYGVSESEPLEKPTEELASETPDEAEEVDEVEVTDEAESEELEAEPQEEADDNGDIEYHEINGKEYTASDIKALESGNLMQSDYTKKTQAHAKEVEAFTEERNLFDAEKAKVADLSAQLEVLVVESESIDWAELKEYEPEEYIKQKEIADNRKAKLAEVKASQQQPQQQQAMTEADQKTILSANPQWLTDGKQDAENKEYVKDMNMIVEYAASIGLSIPDVQSMNKSGHWLAMLDAAKYAQQKKNGSALGKKVRKAPKVTKPKANKTTQRKSRESVFYGDSK